MKARLMVALLTLAVACGACGKDNPVKPPMIQQPIYPKLVNPYSVLDAYEMAYTRKDTVEIKLLYDDNYQGSSIDQTSPNPALLQFTKADEVAHVAKLAATAGADVLILSANNRIRSADPSDPPGWAMIQDPFFRLEFLDPSTAYVVNLQSEINEFKFIPHTPDATSPTDTTWKIVRWAEVKN